MKISPPGLTGPRLLLLVIALFVLNAGACGKSSSQSSPPGAPAPASSAAHVAAASNPASLPAASDEAFVRQAVEKHLQANKGINLSVMDMSFDSVSVKDDHAQADVTFRLKQGGTSMQMTYQLERHADNWIVLKSQPSGGQFAHPPMDDVHRGMGSPQGSKALPDISSFFPPAPPSKNSQPN